MFNKKSKMMIEVTEMKLELIEGLMRMDAKDIGEESEVYQCRSAQATMLKELLRYFKQIQNGTMTTL